MAGGPGLLRRSRRGSRKTGLGPEARLQVGKELSNQARQSAPQGARHRLRRGRAIPAVENRGSKRPEPAQAEEGPERPKQLRVSTRHQRDLTDRGGLEPGTGGSGWEDAAAGCAARGQIAEVGQEGEGGQDYRPGRQGHHLDGG